MYYYEFIFHLNFKQVITKILEHISIQLEYYYFQFIKIHYMIPTFLINIVQIISLHNFILLLVVNLKQYLLHQKLKMTLLVLLI